MTDIEKEELELINSLLWKRVHELISTNNELIKELERLNYALYKTREVGIIPPCIDRYESK